MSSEKINAIAIIEMMGKPPEHVKEELAKHLDKISLEKGIKVISRKINIPKKIENSALFSSFAEVELEIDNLNSLMVFLFAYMPSHIEIVEPESIKISNYDISTLCNEVARKMHQYDSIAKTIMIEKNMIENQLKQHGIQPIDPIAPIVPTQEKSKKKSKKKKR